MSDKEEALADDEFLRLLMAPNPQVPLSETIGIAALDQRIRYRAKKLELVPRKRKGSWWFADYNNALQSPEEGIDSDEAYDWLMQD